MFCLALNRNHDPTRSVLFLGSFELALFFKLFFFLKALAFEAGCSRYCASNRWDPISLAIGPAASRVARRISVKDFDERPDSSAISAAKNRLFVWGGSCDGAVGIAAWPLRFRALETRNRNVGQAFTV